MSWTLLGWSCADSIWKTLEPKFGTVTCWTSAFFTPAPSSVSTTPSSSVGFSSAAVIRVPDLKSMPKFSSLVDSATAPISRITPERVKNQRLAPMKSKCQRRPSPPAPRALGEFSSFELLSSRAAPG